MTTDRAPWGATLALSLLAIGVPVAAHAGEFGSSGAVSSGRAPLGGTGAQGFQGTWSQEVSVAAPAFHGLEPRLAVRYSAASNDDGPAGVGTSLAGFSSITRRSAGHGAPWLDDARDVYYLDGTRLYPCPAGATSPGCQPATGAYTTERESRVRIERLASSWKVTQADGTAAVYESIEWTGVVAVRWGVTRTTDVHGNTVTYRWQDLGAEEQPLPSEVAYNGVSVTLTWEPRPDVDTSSLSGLLRRQSRRLASVVVTVGGARRRGLAFSYALAPVTGRSRLIRVQESGRDPSAVLPATTWNWADNDARAFVGQPSGVQVTPLVGFSFFQLADLDGDGKADWVEARRSGTGTSTLYTVALRRSLGTGGFAPFGGVAAPPQIALPVGYHLWLVADVDADGKADAVMSNQPAGQPAQTVLVWFGNGVGGFSGTATTTLATAPAARIPSELADVDGDGLVDLVSERLFGTVTSDIAIHRGAGRGPFGAGITLGIPVTARLRGAYDVSGDGRKDLVLSQTEGTSDHRTYVLLANGDGTFQPPVMTATTLPFARMADVNGDYLDDLITARTCDEGVDVRLSLGNGRFRATAVHSQTRARAGWTTNEACNQATFVDVSGDGADDLVAFYRNTVLVYESLRDGRFADDTNLGPDGTVARVQQLTLEASTGTECPQSSFADIAGHGRLDLVRHCQRSTEVPGHVFIRDGGFPDELRTVTNGYGGTTRLGYQASTLWRNDSLIPPFRTLRTLDTDDGRGGVAQTMFEYSGGKYDRRERRFLGFGYYRETAPALSYEPAPPFTETWYRQDLPTLGMVDHSVVQVYDADLGRYLPTGKQAFVYGTSAAIPYAITQTDAWTWTCVTGSDCVADPTQARKHQVTTWFDAAGRPTRMVDQGLDELAGDESQTITTYAPTNTTRFIIGPPAVTTSYSGTSATPGAALRLSQYRWYYDGAASLDATPSKGQVTAVEAWLKRPDETTERYVRSTFAYDAYGNQTSATDARGTVTLTEFDATAHVYPIRTTAGFGTTAAQVVETAWDTVCGAPTTVSDVNSTASERIVSTTSYDSLCRPYYTRTPTVGSTYAWTRTTFCRSGATDNPCEDPTRRYQLVQSNPRDGTTTAQWTRSYSDGLGRVYRTESEGPTATRNIVQETRYDARGQVEDATPPYYSGDLPVHVGTFYDSQGRTTSVVHADGTSVTFEYLVRPRGSLAVTTRRTIDESGHVAEDDADVFGQVIASRAGDPWGDPAHDPWVESRSFYDLRGDLVRTTDAMPVAGAPARGTEPVAEAYTYDSMGRRIEERSPDRGTWRFTHDDADNVLTARDPLGQLTRWTYDELGRVRTTTLRAGTPQAQTTSYAYDEPRRGFYNRGRLTTMTDGSGSHRQNYDKLGRLVTEVRVIDGIAYPRGYGYDAVGQLLWTRYPDGTQLGTAASPLRYDGAGRLRSIPGFVTSAEYDASGRLVRWVNANGTTTDQTWSRTRGWLEAIVTRSRSGATLQSLDYTGRAADGMLVRVASAIDTDDWTYGYDALHRLTSANDQGFGYAANGNVTWSSRLGAYTYPAPSQPRPHAVTSAGGRMFAYDANGNMTQRNGEAIVYDGADRPVQMGALSFAIDGTGARLKKIAPGRVTLYPSAGVEIASDACSDQVTTYVSLGGVMVAKSVSGNRIWVHTDQLGSVQAETNTAGAETLRQRYQPYGEAQLPQSPAVESHGFAGQETDESGLQYLGARYYDPLIGRFIAADPTTADGTNRYMYARNNPVGFVDPTGYDAEAMDLGSWDMFDDSPYSYGEVDFDAISSIDWLGSSASFSDPGPFTLLSGTPSYSLGSFGHYDVTPIGVGDLSMRNAPPSVSVPVSLPAFVLGPTGLKGEQTGEEAAAALERWETRGNHWWLNGRSISDFRVEWYSPTLRSETIPKPMSFAVDDVRSQTSPEGMIEAMMNAAQRQFAGDTNYVCRHHAAYMIDLAREVPEVSRATLEAAYRPNLGGHAWNEITISNRTFVVDAYSGISYERWRQPVSALTNAPPPITWHP